MSNLINFLSKKENKHAIAEINLNHILMKIYGSKKMKVRCFDLAEI